MIDKKAFYNLSYGMYVVTAAEGGKPVGCVANTFAQITSSPYQVSVVLNKENATTRAVLSEGRYVATCLSEDAPMELIGAFGFHSSDEYDKFEGFKVARDEAGVPYVDEHYVSRFSVRVVKTLDVGTHVMFIGEVEESQVAAGNPMTYAFYHSVKGGKTPPRASSYVAEDEPSQDPDGSKKTIWKCSVCGYEYEGDVLPDGFKCPICGVGADKFVRQ